MTIVPIDKFDLKSCENLRRASNAEVIAELDELLAWTADANWPVASHVFNRLQTLGEELVPPLKSILSSFDEGWKYFIIVHLISRVKQGVFDALKTDLERIANTPTPSEIVEEVQLEATQVLRDRTGAKERILSIRVAGNTQNPALITLQQKGYRLWLEPDDPKLPEPDFLNLNAEKDGRYFSATGPEELLGLVAIWEARGDDWHHHKNEPNLVLELIAAVVEIENKQSKT